MARRSGYFADHLRKVMFERGLTQEQLGSLIGSNQRVISRWLTGNRSPSLPSIRKIAAALDLPINFFVENSGGVVNTGVSGDISVGGMDEKDIKILKLEKQVLELKLKLKELKK